MIPLEVSDLGSYGGARLRFAQAVPYESMPGEIMLAVNALQVKGRS